MIAHITGSVMHVGSDFLVIDVSGVGYKVHVVPETIGTAKKSAGKELGLWTHLAVRETSLDMYGFENRGELEFFELLIAISGIGPKSGLAILGLADIETLRSAIRAQDSSYLTKVSGIGKKSAERIIIELRDKLGVEEGESDGGALLKEEVDTIEALKALGYQHREARETLQKVPKEITGTSERLKEALKILGK